MQFDVIYGRQQLYIFCFINTIEKKEFLKFINEIIKTASFMACRVLCRCYSINLAQNNLQCKFPNLGKISLNFSSVNSISNFEY